MPFRPISFAVLTTLFFSATFPALAEETPMEQTVIRPGDAATLENYEWLNRPLVIFADSPNDPRFVQQIGFITDGLEELADRDVVVLTDTQRDGSALRDRLRPRGFALVLIAKDGTVFLRKPAPWDVREITRVIDKMPDRQQEVRERRGGR